LHEAFESGCPLVLLPDGAGQAFRVAGGVQPMDSRIFGMGVWPVESRFLGCEPKVANIAFPRAPSLAMLPNLPTAAPGAVPNPSERL
jgi:hypothetical protein